MIPIPTGGGGGGGGVSDVGKYLLLAGVVLLFFPMVINVFADVNDEIDSVDDVQDILLDDYNGIINVDSDREQAWVLTGIYTAYGQNANGTSSTQYLVLDDGWIAGQRITSYTPSQYTSADNSLVANESYTVAYNSSDKMYYYTSVSNGGYEVGDLYTRVSMDVNHMSSVFFTQDGKITSGSNFYYSFNGWRYTFQPTSNYDGVTSSGETKPIVADTSSLSLIWYYYLTDTGIAGQLVISGTDEGVNYLTGKEIVAAFNSNNYTSKFTMEFNGIDMYVYIIINPVAISQGYTVEECYNAGYWSMAITSASAQADAYSNTDYSFSIQEIFNTIMALLSFNASDYFSGDETAGYLASIIFCGTFYIILIAIGLNHHMVLIIAALLAQFQLFVNFFEPITDAVTGIAKGLQKIANSIINTVSSAFDWWPFW